MAVDHGDVGTWKDVMMHCRPGHAVLVGIGGYGDRCKGSRESLKMEHIADIVVVVAARLITCRLNRRRDRPSLWKSLRPDGPVGRPGCTAGWHMPIS